METNIVKSGKSNEIDNKKNITSLTGIKVIALLMIFYQHSTMPQLPLGLGSRMCELLFVLSGFLVGYNKYNKVCPCTFKAGFDYVAQKLIVFYPLHVIITLFRAVLEYRSFTQINTWIKLLLSLSLLTPWSPYEDTFFAFNGSSWFLAALLFCYFLSPVFIRLSKTRYPILILTITFFIRFSIDAIPKYTTLDFLAVHTHVNPFVRSLEFFMGLLLAPLFFRVKNKFKGVVITKKIFLLFSIIEILVVFMSIFSMYKFLDVLPKSCFVLLFCIFIFIFSFNIGIISRFFSFRLFKIFNKVQFEFFLSHTTFLSYCLHLINKLEIDTSMVLVNIIIVIFEFLILTGICFIYKKVVADKLSKIMQVIIKKIYQILELNQTL